MRLPERFGAFVNSISYNVVLQGKCWAAPDLGDDLVGHEYDLADHASPSY